MRFPPGLWKPEPAQIQEDYIVPVWATATDSDRAAEGPQPQKELDEFVGELKTDDFNQRG